MTLTMSAILKLYLTTFFKPLRCLIFQEKERLKQQEEEKKYLAQVEAQKLEMQKLINKHNHTLKTNVSSSSLVTQTAAQDKSLNR